MTNDHRGIAARTTALVDDPGFQNELAQVRAKAALSMVGATTAQPRWTYRVHRFARNSIAALHGITRASETAPAEWMRQYGRPIGIAWENLARIGEGTSRQAALLNAALAYEFAGYQANAACLAGHLGRVLSSDEPTIGSLVASLLQRRFIDLRRKAALAMTEPADTTLSEELYIRLGTAVVADALSQAALFFLGGHDHIESSRDLLVEAEDLFARFGAPAESNAIAALQAVIPVMASRSTWNILSAQAKNSPTWQRYLKLIARGSGGLSSRGVTELWPSQIIAIESGAIGTDEGLVLRLPTSGGKTRLAELAIVDTLARYPGSKCIFVAPFKALVSEVESSLAPARI
jgi:helicase